MLDKVDYLIDLNKSAIYVLPRPSHRYPPH